MTQIVNPTPPEASAETDLVAAVQQVLQTSDEPLTLSKVRAQLPARFRSIPLEELADCLNRQVAAQVVQLYPRYRSRQDRYWDRSMPVHVTMLLRGVLREASLPWSELRRKLPAYAQPQAEEVLRDLVDRGEVFRHPRPGSRGGDHYALQPPDPKDYLGPELVGLFRRLEQLGFNQSQVRAAALELLHDEEWAPIPPAEEAQPEMAEARVASPVPQPQGPSEPDSSPPAHPVTANPPLLQADYPIGDVVPPAGGVLLAPDVMQPPVSQPLQMPPDVPAGRDMTLGHPQPS
jgi:hypothetical protein